MNIIEYKVNEDKLRELIERAESKSLIDIKIYLNYETLQMIEAKYPKYIRELGFNPIVCHIGELTPYYMGYPFVIDKRFAVGEVKILGFKERQCSRVTVYADGTPPKIEDNVVDKTIVCIE